MTPPPEPFDLLLVFFRKFGDVESVQILALEDGRIVPICGGKYADAVPPIGVVQVGRLHPLLGVWGEAMLAKGAAQGVTVIQAFLGAFFSKNGKVFGGQLEMVKVRGCG